MQYIHGGDIYSRRIKIDFSANINPLGTPPEVIAAARDSMDRIGHYPDSSCRRLIHALSEYERLSERYFICGNGAAELIFNAVQALLPKRALLAAPAFLEYEQALRTVGCRISHWIAQRENGYRITEEFLTYITPETDIIFLCNPNNPTGALLEPQLLERIIRKCRQTRTMLILDECFLDLTTEHKKRTKTQEVQNGNTNLLILKAFTKQYAMAGLRLGYAVSANGELLEKMKGIRQPWSVSIPAQEAGIAALGQREYLRKSVELITQERKFLSDGLKQAGCQVYDGTANFLFFESRPDLWEKCLERGILIRDCSNYQGLSKGSFRIAVRGRQENLCLLQALEEIGSNIVP
ncbi:MAG: aminotransferase class I/II-fold pyridoxal phosphate-dependent enzyme [Eubacterium sp.]|nr:aminotransferase class I/II-fold pyridoxal phosphate-dependent enzyme [Eubacterium sp.]